MQNIIRILFRVTFVSTFFYYKNVQKIKKTLKRENVTKIQKRKNVLHICGGRARVTDVSCVSVSTGR